MPDLFGKPDKAPYVAPSPFYCYRCTGTHSKKCKGCETRICSRHSDLCDRCWATKEKLKEILTSAKVNDGGERAE